jgi:energy-coupling factor transporter ATP-binding protein EcfA2
VGDELSFTLRRMRHPKAAVQRRVDEVLDLCGLGPHRERSPLRLSFGEQHRVAVASALAAEMRGIAAKENES